VRSRQAIAHDIAQAEALLRRLRHEYALARLTPRNAGIVADKAAGMANAEIAIKWDVSYGVVRNVLHREVVAAQETRIREKLAACQDGAPA
jgi:hypothetical protein